MGEISDSDAVKYLDSNVVPESKAQRGTISAMMKELIIPVNHPHFMKLNLDKVIRRGMVLQLDL